MQPETESTSRLFRSLVFLAILLCLLVQGCGSVKKTGTIVSEGTAVGIEISDKGETGPLLVVFNVKLDDGLEVKAVHSVPQETRGSFRGKRVELEPTDASKEYKWRVTRTSTNSANGVGSEK